MKIHFEQFGDGKPIILLHAFPLSGDMWRPQIEGITSNNFCLICPDFRGFGKTELSSDASLDTFAKDIFELLEDLGIEKAIIGGLSMGGYVLFNLYRMFPERFSAIVLADTNCAGDSEEKREGRFKLIERIKKDGPRALIDTMLPNLTGDFTKANNPDLVNDLENEFLRVSPGGAINALQAMAHRKDHTYLLNEINVPTLIIFGEDDKTINLEIGKNIASNIRNAQLVEIKKAGHYSNLEQPESFTNSLLRFARSVNS